MSEGTYAPQTRGVAQAYFTNRARIAALRKTLQSVEQGQPHPMIRHIEEDDC